VAVAKHGPPVVVVMAAEVEEFERLRALEERMQSPENKGRSEVAIKKSDLYSSLWASCDELRASQYKDYVLFMLFIKYITDKYGNSDDFAPPVTIPKGASFKDIIALKGKSDIGDKINTEIIRPLIDANTRLARSDFPDFNDPNKLGEGQRWWIA
jgi:type I restriction enzyme M protein